MKAMLIDLAGGIGLIAFGASVILSGVGLYNFYEKFNINHPFQWACGIFVVIGIVAGIWNQYFYY